LEAYILLEDGTLFEGKSIGYAGKSLGEICFTTSMTGYQEVFTDPSYFGQILIMTTAHIGNYGTIPLENESEDPKINGLVIRNFSQQFSRQLSDQSLEDYLKDHKIVGIEQVDTRALVRYIRQKGAMNAIVVNDGTDLKEAKKKLDKHPSMNGMELASQVSTEKPYYLGNEDSWYHIAVLDLGVKRNILSNLMMKNCYLKVFPAKTPIEEIERWNPDAYFISNGPGDPASMPYAIDFIKSVLTINKPLFGICLGHQLLCLAMGIPTYKLHHGHRGINHPVRNLVSGTCEITTQNHGFGVDAKAVQESKEVEVTHVNLNDQSVEGIRVKNKYAFSVQYHPEANPGPHDSNYLFQEFINLIDKSKPHE
jgi:carbamoyl-phosphate synthase small subunit